MKSRLIVPAALSLLLAAVSACAVLTSSPGGSAGSACAWEVCVATSEVPGGRVYEVINREPVPATVQLTFRSLQNLRTATRMPVTRIVPPRSSLPIVRLHTVVRGRSIGAQPELMIDLGSSHTEPDSTHLYAVPFGGSDARELIQGFDGSDTHRLGMRYALDFAMPEGTPVLAAREGTVLYVQDGFTTGGRDPDLIERSNLVVVAHDDGTMASYGHLSAGIVVRKGDAVRAGDLLGYSGNTGFAGQPHLHFHVGVRLLGDPGRTVPIQLRGPEGGPLVLEVGSTIEPARP
ncbi:MAG: M23 family metallopeptidase [Gemmatimonadota bacterium]